MYRICTMLCSVILLFVSCKTNQKTDSIYYELQFAELQQISQNRNTSFCLVLYDSSQVSSQIYVDRLNHNYSSLFSNKGLFSFVDITLDENEWYYKLLSPNLLPLTCVFSKTGELIDLISGNTKESFLYTEKSLSNQKANMEFHYNQQYGVEKVNVINDLDCLLKLKIKMDCKENVITKFDSLLNDTIRYPYALFLKLQNQLQFGDTIAAKYTANAFLQFDSPNYLIEYYDEFIIAQKVIDPTYSNASAPSIKLMPADIDLVDCIKDKSIPLTFTIENTGQRPLKISDILTSCTCVKLKSKKRYTIAPMQSVDIEFNFIPDASGEIFREIYVASNSINTPISRVTINAMVD